MKIAVATDGVFVANHFGRCPQYTIVTVHDRDIVNQVTIPNPGHEPGFLPRYLAERGVNCIIAGGMGPRAQGLFEARGIQTVTGVSGYIKDSLNSYLSGQLVSKDNLCDHEDGQEHHEHGQCHHG